jgi:hypothetical protein
VGSSLIPESSQLVIDLWFIHDHHGNLKDTPTQQPTRGKLLCAAPEAGLTSDISLAVKVSMQKKNSSGVSEGP